MKAFLQALRYYRKETPAISVALLMLLATTAAGLVKPWPLALLADSVIGTRPLPAWAPNFLIAADKASQLGWLAGAAIFFHLLQAVLGSFQNKLLINIGLRGLQQIRVQLFEKLHRLSLKFHLGSQSGDILYRATWDTFAFQTLFQHGIFAALSSLLYLGLMLLIMWRLNPILTLVSLSTIPLLLMIIVYFTPRMTKLGAEGQTADSEVANLLQESLAALTLTWSSTREPDQVKRFDDQVDKSLVTRRHQHGIEVLYLTLIASVFGIAIGVVTWIGGSKVMAGTLSLGELLLFLAYLGQLFEPLNQLSKVGSVLPGATAGTSRVIEILEAKEDLVDGTEPLPPVGIQGVKGDIALENVSFGYLPGKLILNNTSIVIPAGKKVALVGPSGIGKSTLLHLLVRFFDPTEGRITLDGQELRTLKLRDLRSNLAFMQQEPLLIRGTVAENIAWGRPGALQQEIEEAARLSQAHLFIERLPLGYNTLIGEGAARLSVGERQRVNLARTLLKKAPVLLMDEPTSALDQATEESITEALAAAWTGKTALIVTHRPAILKHVDLTLRLDQSGRLTVDAARA